MLCVCVRCWIDHCPVSHLVQQEVWSCAHYCLQCRIRRLAPELMLSKPVRESSRLDPSEMACKLCNSGSSDPRHTTQPRHMDADRRTGSAGSVFSALLPHALLICLVLGLLLRSWSYCATCLLSSWVLCHMSCRKPQSLAFLVALYTIYFIPYTILLWKLQNK